MSGSGKNHCNRCGSASVDRLDINDLCKDCAVIGKQCRFCNQVSAIGIWGRNLYECPLCFRDNSNTTLDDAHRELIDTLIEHNIMLCDRLDKVVGKLDKIEWAVRLGISGDKEMIAQLHKEGLI
jgi:hypothetical protein